VLVALVMVLVTVYTGWSRRPACRLRADDRPRLPPSSGTGIARLGNRAAVHAAPLLFPLRADRSMMQFSSTIRRRQNITWQGFTLRNYVTCGPLADHRP
jgi:hypothetical protein